MSFVHMGNSIPKFLLISPWARNRPRPLSVLEQIKYLELLGGDPSVLSAEDFAVPELLGLPIPGGGEDRVLFRLQVVQDFPQDIPGILQPHECSRHLLIRGPA